MKMITRGLLRAVFNKEEKQKIYPPQKTNLCLSFVEIGDVLKEKRLLSEEELTHKKSCRYCRMTWGISERLEKEWQKSRTA